MKKILWSMVVMLTGVGMLTSCLSDNDNDDNFIEDEEESESKE